ncbi:hypothetical protein BGY98DRAFT_1101651 [Russula aff. rugulosa BPL654]|nr:hypothetical protein BGY98DRAFT_1101651 [Russula aff. rugulosa BPL654]
MVRLPSVTVRSSFGQILVLLTDLKALVVDDEPEEDAVKIVDLEEPQEECWGTVQKKNKGCNLEGHHHVKISEQLEVKKETTKDLLTICLNIIVVKFKTKEMYEIVKGQWCWNRVD